MTFKFLTEDNQALIDSQDTSDKKFNKWSWAWLTLKYDCKVRDKDVTFTLDQFYKKIDIKGSAFCYICDAIVNYGSRGSNAL